MRSVESWNPRRWSAAVWLAAVTGSGAYLVSPHDQVVPVDALSRLPRIASRLRGLGLLTHGRLDGRRLESMRSLEVLSVHSPLAEPVDLSDLRRLRSLSVTERGKVGQFASALGREGLLTADLAHPSTDHLALLASSIRELSISSPPSDVPRLRCASSLTRLTISTARRVVDLGDLSGAPLLKELSLDSMTKQVTGFASLAGNTALQELFIQNVPDLERPETVLTLPNLKTLWAWDRHPFSQSIVDELSRRGIAVNGRGNTDDDERGRTA